MRRGPTVLFAYFVLGALGVVGSVVAGNDPLGTTAWLGTTAFASVWRFQWARALHAELRPVTRGVGEAELFLTALGLLFVATGSLIGCVVAHVAINAANLRFLRDRDLAPKPRRLGGLLQRNS